MYLSRSGSKLRWSSSKFLIVVLFCCVSCSVGTQPNSPNSQTNSPGAQTTVSSPTNPTNPTNPVLPGQQTWKEGVSSFLFGTNDTQEWSSNNVETNPHIQQTLKDAHFTLMRTFFFDKSLADSHPTTDAEIEQRLKTIENSGMTCLGVLQNVLDLAFDQHVVAYAGSRCQLYEFGNEPSFNGISSDTYLKQWNMAIPLLRQINPHAKFIGPVDAVNDFLQAFLLGVSSSNVLPDAVSFHWYPCWQNTRDDCLNKANSVAYEVQQVRTLVQGFLGKDLPIGITEWNYDPNNPPPAYGDESDFITKFTTNAMQSMIQANVAFACQFDIASYSGYGRLDMFNVETNQPKPQYYTMKSIIAKYRA